MSKKKTTTSAYGLGGLWRESGDIPHLSSSGVVAHLGLQAWRSFLHSPLTSILTIVTITTALLVFSMFILVLENVKELVSSAQSELAVSLYLKEGLAAEKVKTLQEMISKEEAVEQVQLRTKELALSDFRSALGDKAGILDGLEGVNPLPASLEVKFKDGAEVADQIENFVTKLKQDEKIEHVDYSRGLITKLSGFFTFFRWAGFFSIVFMLLITSFIITNTIRLALYSHREEIEIMKLVGATDAFIRAPYMIEGFVQGLVGALVSLFVAYSAYSVFQDIVTGNEILTVFVSSIKFLSFYSILLILICGVSVGLLGSYLAVRRFLNN